MASPRQQPGCRLYVELLRASSEQSRVGENARGSKTLSETRRPAHLPRLEYSVHRRSVLGLLGPPRRADGSVAGRSAKARRFRDQRVYRSVPSVFDVAGFDSAPGVSEAVLETAARVEVLREAVSGRR